MSFLLYPALPSRRSRDLFSVCEMRMCGHPFLRLVDLKHVDGRKSRRQDRLDTMLLV